MSMFTFVRRLLDRLYCWWLTETTDRYYRRRAITVNGELREAIYERNFKALRWVSYSIKRLINVKGMPDLLEELALIKKRGPDSERQFNNKLTELYAACFLNKMLGEKVLEIESRSNKIRSPFTNNEKYCDLKTSVGEEEFYYEVKDASSEITSSCIENGETFFDRMDDKKVERWIKDQTKEADKCGANYLICRVPVWLNDATNVEDFYLSWVNRIFKTLFQVKQRVSTRELVVKPNFNISFHMKGIYLVKAFGHIKVVFQQEQSSNQQIQPTVFVGG